MMKSKQRILFGCYAMVLAIIGDYLLGYLKLTMPLKFKRTLGYGWDVLQFDMNIPLEL